MFNYGYGGENVLQQQGDTSWTDVISTIGNVAANIIASVRGQPVSTTTTTTPIGSTTRTTTNQADTSGFFWLAVVVIGFFLLFRK